MWKVNDEYQLNKYKQKCSDETNNHPCCKQTKPFTARLVGCISIIYNNTSSYKTVICTTTLAQIPDKGEHFPTFEKCQLSPPICSVSTINKPCLKYQEMPFHVPKMQEMCWRLNSARTPFEELIALSTDLSWWDSSSWASLDPYNAYE